MSWPLQPGRSEPNPAIGDRAQDEAGRWLAPQAASRVGDGCSDQPVFRKASSASHLGTGSRNQEGSDGCAGVLCTVVALAWTVDLRGLARAAERRQPLRGLPRGGSAGVLDRGPPRKGRRGAGARRRRISAGRPGGPGATATSRTLPAFEVAVQEVLRDVWLAGVALPLLVTARVGCGDRR